jgi:dienelactone hydrolase
VASNAVEAIAIRDEIGWLELTQRAAHAIAGVPPTAVLGGFSLGAGIAASVWPARPKASALLFLHGIFPMPDALRRGLPIQVHLAEPDDFESERDIADFIEGERQVESALEMFRYPGPGHLFTDETLPDYDPRAAELAWERVIAFLDAIDEGRNR